MIRQMAAWGAVAGTTHSPGSLHSPGQELKHLAVGCGCLASLNLFYVSRTL